MQFTLVVMQLNGEVTDRRPYTHAEVRAGARGGVNVADGCHSLLREKVPAIQTDVARFQLHIDTKERLELVWRQPTPHAAMAMFIADGRPAFSAVFLSGREAVADFVAARVSESFLAELPWARAAGSTIALPPDRPLTVLTPWPPDMAEGDRRRVFLWVLGLSVAFFERAAVSIPQPFSPN